MLGYADLLRGAETQAETRRLAAQYIYHESERLEALGGKLMALMRLNGEPPRCGRSRWMRYCGGCGARCRPARRNPHCPCAG